MLMLKLARNPEPRLAKQGVCRTPGRIYGLVALMLLLLLAACSGSSKKKSASDTGIDASADATDTGNDAAGDASEDTDDSDTTGGFDTVADTTVVDPCADVAVGAACGCGGVVQCVSGEAACRGASRTNACGGCAVATRASMRLRWHRPLGRVGL
jgi:hypothetical protein